MLPAGTRSIGKQTWQAHQEICQWKVSTVGLACWLGAASPGAVRLEVDGPSEDRDQSAAKVAAFGGDCVLDPRRHLGVERTFNKSQGLKLAQAVRQRSRTDSLQLAREIVESHSPLVPKDGDDEEGPPLAQNSHEVPHGVDAVFLVPFSNNAALSELALLRRTLAFRHPFPLPHWNLLREATNSYWLPTVGRH